MIAHRLGLAIAFACAVVLGLIVVLDRDERLPASRTLVAGFDADQLTRLAWARSGEPEIVIERAGTAWRWTRPLADIPADAAAIDSIGAALRGGRWHRRAPRAKAGTHRVTLTATAGARAIAVSIGEAIAGTGQTWLAIGAHAYLVDDWIARALAPAPLALRETRPLRDVASAQTIVVDRPGFTARLEGMPRKLVRPVELYLDPALVGALERALAALTIASLPTRPLAVDATYTIDAGGGLVTLEHSPTGCDGDAVAVGGTYGPGCIPRAQWAAVDHAIADLRQPERADDRLLPFDPVRITLADGSVLDLAKRPRIGDRDADPVPVAELLATLAAHHEVVEAGTAQPIATLVATSRANTAVTLELLASKRVRREGEPVELVVGAGAWDVLTRPSSRLRDPTPWREEPTTIRSITIDDATYTRGAVVGEWTGPGDDLARIEGLARMLATPTVTLARRPPARILHTITFEVASPGGVSTTRTLQLGAGCRAVADGEALSLEPALCAALAGRAGR